MRHRLFAFLSRRRNAQVYSALLDASCSGKGDEETDDKQKREGKRREGRQRRSEETGMRRMDDDSDAYIQPAGVRRRQPAKAWIVKSMFSKLRFAHEIDES